MDTSYIKIIEYLEPFLVYDEDITFKQYETIIEFIQEKISAHKKKLIQKIIEFKSYANSIDSYFIPNIYENMIKKKRGENELASIFPSYNIDQNMDNHQAYRTMMNFDCLSFNTALTLTQMSLMQPIDIEEKKKVLLLQKKMKKLKKDLINANKNLH